MKAYEVYIANDDLLFSSGTPIKVYWSPQSILPLRLPESYSVDIELMELNVTSGVWNHLVTLGTDLDNNGYAEVMIPDIEAVDDFDSSVSPVVVRVSVSSASTSIIDNETSKRGTASDILTELGRKDLRTMKTSQVRYLKKLARQVVQRLLCEAWGLSQPDNIGQEILARLPPCPRTAAGARAPNSGFKEERLSSLIPRRVRNIFNTTTFDDKFRTFFHPNTSSCFRQIITDRSVTCTVGLMACLPTILKMNELCTQYLSWHAYLGHRLEVQDSSVAMTTGMGSLQDLLVEEQWI